MPFCEEGVIHLTVCMAQTSITVQSYTRVQGLRQRNHNHVDQVMGADFSDEEFQLFQLQESMIQRRSLRTIEVLLVSPKKSSKAIIPSQSTRYNECRENHTIWIQTIVGAG